MINNSRKFKDSIYEQFGRVGKAIASPTRLEILDLLCQGPRTVEVLANEVNQSIANTSQHLQTLRAVKFVEAEKQGLFVTYRLADNDVCDFYRMLRDFAEYRLFEIGYQKNQYLEQHGLSELVDKKRLLQRILSGDVTILDVRPIEEYAAGHIAGSISIPLQDLKQRLTELPYDQEIVAYCRGPYCVLAVKAVELLRKNGFKAERLEDGVTDWRAQGFQLEYTNVIM